MTEKAWGGISAITRRGFIKRAAQLGLVLAGVSLVGARSSIPVFACDPDCNGIPCISACECAGPYESGSATCEFQTDCDPLPGFDPCTNYFALCTFDCGTYGCCFRVIGYSNGYDYCESC